MVTWDIDETPFGPVHRAWSDQMQIGIVARRPGDYWWDATYAARMNAVPGVDGGAGSVTTLDEGKLAVERAWSMWLRTAGITPA